MSASKRNLARARREDISEEMAHDLADLLDEAELDLEGDYS